MQYQPRPIRPAELNLWITKDLNEISPVEHQLI